MSGLACLPYRNEANAEDTVLSWRRNLCALSCPLGVEWSAMGRLAEGRRHGLNENLVREIGFGAWHG